MEENILKLKEKIENIRNKLNIKINENIDINEYEKKEKILATSEELDKILLEYEYIVKNLK